MIRVKDRRYIVSCDGIKCKAVFLNVQYEEDAFTNNPRIYCDKCFKKEYARGHLAGKRFIIHLMDIFLKTRKEKLDKK